MKLSIAGLCVFSIALAACHPTAPISAPVPPTVADDPCISSIFSIETNKLIATEMMKNLNVWIGQNCAFEDEEGCFDKFLLLFLTRLQERYYAADFVTINAEMRADSDGDSTLEEIERRVIRSNNEKIREVCSDKP